MNRKRMLLILISLFLVFFITGCKQNVGTPEDNAVVEEKQEDGDSAERLYGFSGYDLSDPFSEVLKESVRASVEEKGGRILVRDAKGSTQTQISQVRELIGEKVEAVFLCPADPSGITPALEMLEESDIPVIDLSVRTEQPDLTDAFIGSDDYNAGRLCGEDLCGRKAQGGSLLIIDRPDQLLGNEGITGFEEAVADRGFEVQRIDAGDDQNALTARLEGIISEKNSLDAVMCADDNIAELVLAVLEEKGIQDIFVYSIGGSPAIKSALADPTSPMTGIGAKSPIIMGKTAEKTAAAILDNGVYESETYIETFFINSDNVDMYGTNGWQ